MATREIKYRVKNTKANTTYIVISDLDRKFIFNELSRITEFVETCKEFDHPELVRILYETTVMDDNLPKCGYKPYKPNSMYSYINGLLHNLSVGGQRDLTKNNIEPIEYITDYINDNLLSFTKILFKHH